MADTTENGQLPINDSIVCGMGTLPEAKIWPVKGMAKRGIDFGKSVTCIIP
jgi:hypothetical protein